LLNHLILKLTSIENFNDVDLLSANLHRVSGHLLDLFNRLRILPKLVQTFSDELINIIRVLLNRLLQSLNENIRQSAEQALNSVLKGVKLDSYTVNLDFIR
jgi:hypothetical protein